MIHGYKPPPAFIGINASTIELLVAMFVKTDTHADGTTMTDSPLVFTARQLIAGTDGSIVYRMLDDTTDTTQPVTAGQEISGFFSHIKATGTTCYPLIIRY